MYDSAGVGGGLGEDEVADGAGSRDSLFWVEVSSTWVLGAGDTVPRGWVLGGGQGTDTGGV